MTKLTSSRVIVDTSVFISFFRGKAVRDFDNLILGNNIVLSPFVRLELLQGIRKTELSSLEYVLESLETIPFSDDTYTETEILLNEIKGRGYQLGLIDLFIAAESRLYNIPVYSFDKAFKILADNKLIPSFDHTIH